MPSTKQVKILRFFEHFILFLLVLLVSGLAGFSVLGKLGATESYIGGGVTVVMLLILFLLQKKVGSWLSITISQTSYSQDGAFTSLYDRSPVAYLTIKKNGHIIGGNPAAVKLLQGKVDSINEANFFDLILPSSEFEPSILKSKVDGGITVDDIEIPLKTFYGKDIWVLFSVYKFRSKGERLVSMVDITEQKHVDTAKSEFVALATHQLRTPISAIRWNVELLQKNMQEIQTDKQARYLDKIERNVIRMINLINDFLSVSKLEMGTFAAKEEDIVLNDFFSGIADEFAGKIAEKEITLNRSEVPENLTIKADTRLFHIIVSNLVSNAVKYLNQNGTLTMSYELKEGDLEIVVADNGIGIPESEISKLFSKFYRASNAQSHDTEGTGLGLYIIQQSVEQLSGVVTVQSAKDKGAKFVVTIPAKVVSA